MVKSRITLQKALGTVVWHRAGGFALVQALLPDRLFIINCIVIANQPTYGPETWNKPKQMPVITKITIED